MKMRRGVNPNGTVHCGQAMTSISTDCCRPRATSLFLGRNMLLPKTSEHASHCCGPQLVGEIFVGEVLIPARA